jgi:cell division protein FtsI/penicillin-binding protein 2
MIESGGEAGGLAEVAAQLDDEDTAVDRRDLFKELVGAVAGAVVDKDELERVANLLHDLLEAIVESCDVVFFVVERDYDGVLRHINIIDASEFQRI